MGQRSKVLLLPLHSECKQRRYCSVLPKNPSAEARRNPDSCAASTIFTPQPRFSWANMCSPVLGNGPQEGPAPSPDPKSPIQHLKKIRFHATCNEENILVEPTIVLSTSTTYVHPQNALTLYFLPLSNLPRWLRVGRPTRVHETKLQYLSFKRHRGQTTRCCMCC